MNSIPSNYYPLIGAAVFVVLLYLAKKRGVKMPANPLGPKKSKLVQAFDDLAEQGKELGSQELGKSIAKQYAAEYVSRMRSAFTDIEAKPVPNGGKPADISGA